MGVAAGRTRVVLLVSTAALCKDTLGVAGGGGNNDSSSRHCICLNSGINRCVCFLLLSQATITSFRDSEEAERWFLGKGGSRPHPHHWKYHTTLPKLPAWSWAEKRSGFGQGRCSHSPFPLVGGTVTLGNSCVVS